MVTTVFWHLMVGSVFLLLAPAFLILTVGTALRVLRVPQERINRVVVQLAGRCAEHGVLRGRLAAMEWVGRWAAQAARRAGGR